MKTILVPTDFSKIAENAMDYAVEIAKVFKAKLILIHAYHIPVATTQMAAMLPLHEIERNIELDLKKLKKRIQKHSGKSQVVDCIHKYGFAVDEIRSFIQSNPIDLLIIGMQGAGYLTEKIMGNTASALLKEAGCPILAIDKMVKYKPIKTILFASDLRPVLDTNVYSLMTKIALLFKASISILHVSNFDHQKISVERDIEKTKLDRLLSDTPHAFYDVTNDDIIEGINEFAKEKGLDIVVMLPRKHTLLGGFLNEPNVKRMIFNTKAPLLALN